MSDLPDPGAAAAPEAGLRAAREALAHPKAGFDGSSLLLVTLALFVLAQLGGGLTLTGLATLVAVLLFHEAGHAAGMKLFGYRNVKMFFIPFFGAAVTGKRHGVAGWKEALVLLAGPLPGIALGVVVAVFAVRGRTDMAAAAGMLLWINGFNLLPVAPLDGGRLFNLVLFSRHPLLELAFSGFAALVLLAAAALQMWMLALIGVFMLLGLPRQWRLRAQADALRARWPDWSAETLHLPEEQQSALLAAAGQALRQPAFSSGQVAASWMEHLHERAAQRPPTAGASAALLALWLVASLVALVGVAMLAGLPASN